jgi:hypothetical protein
MRIIRKFRWVIAILLFIGGLLYLNSAMSNLWAATGPPNACPECYLKVGYMHFFISIFLFVLSIFTPWILRKRKSLK